MDLPCFMQTSILNQFIMAIGGNKIEGGDNSRYSDRELHHSELLLSTFRYGSQ